MHIRKQKRANGRTYLSVVASYRSEDGKNRSKHVRSLGYLDELEKLYSDPVAHFQAELALENAEAKAKSGPFTIKLSPNKKIDKRTDNQIEVGAALVSSYFHRDLGLWSFFERKRTARKVDYDPGRILELLVCNRLINPSSKKAAWESRCTFPRKCEFSLDDVYRSLSYFNTYADELVKHMNTTLTHTRGSRNTSHLYYDVTNYYFEVENEDDLRRRGVSKENRPNPIVQMGLLLDGSGIPLDYEIFPGNQNDMATMLPVMKKAGLRSVGSADDSERPRTIIVADKGLNTSNNIAACTLDNNGFILSQSVRRATKTLKAWVLDERGYTTNKENTFKIKSRISDKTISIKGEDGKTNKVKVPIKEVAFWSKDFFERSRYERACVVEKSRAAIATGEMSSAACKTSVRYAKDKPVVKETGEAATHNWILDEEKIAADEAMDGYYCIITSEQEMDDHDIIDAYRGLWRIEESFRVLKSDLDARPVYVSREEHIRAHFLICYIALLIMRLMQKDTKDIYSAAEISEALRGVVGHHLDANIWLFDYRSDLTDELSGVVGIDLTRKVMTKAQINKVMSDVKKPRT